MTLTDHGIAAALGERYEAVRLLATGGMGEVWLATDKVLGREVACKVLKAEYAQDAGFRERFVQEARNAALLQHPNVAGVFDFGERPGERPFLVMELVTGPPLTEVLRGGALDPERARDVVAQVADALGSAHAIGLVHRDVKPGNILIAENGTVKLTDFGIARAGDGVALTKTGEIIGTPSYLSPEQAEGRTATAASDVYGLGCVLFECLTGRKPFVGDGPVATALAHLNQPIPELPADIPADLAEVTGRALAKDPERRYADGAELAAALRGDGTRVLAVPTAEVSGMAAPAPQPAMTPWWRRYAPLLLAALAALVLFSALLVAALLDRGETQKPPASAATSQAPRKVNVVKATYLGKEVAVVQAALKKLGLETFVTKQANPGGHVAGTVADVDPDGLVTVGTTVELRVWGAAPPPPVVDDGKDDDEKRKGDDKGKGKGKRDD